MSKHLMIEKVTSPKSLHVPKKLKALLLDSVKRHAWNIGVSHYMGDILYMKEDESHPDGSKTLAMCVVERRYLRACIKIFPEFIKRWKQDGAPFVEMSIAHEVAHIATQHLYECGIATYVEKEEMKDSWETTTEVIGRLSYKLDREIRKI